jgi:hypothetical protein
MQANDQLQAPAALAPGKEPLLPIGQEDGWAPEPVSTLTMRNNPYAFRESNRGLVRSLLTKVTKPHRLPIRTIHQFIRKYRKHVHDHFSTGWNIGVCGNTICRNSLMIYLCDDAWLQHGDQWPLGKCVAWILPTRRRQSAKWLRRGQGFLLATTPKPTLGNTHAIYGILSIPMKFDAVVGLGSYAFPISFLFWSLYYT